MKKRLKMKLKKIVEKIMIVKEMMDGCEEKESGKKKKMKIKEWLRE